MQPKERGKGIKRWKGSKNKIRKDLINGEMMGGLSDSYLKIQACRRI